MKYLFSFLTVALLLIVGCENTIHGFGKDMEHNGEKIQRSE